MLYKNIDEAISAINQISLVHGKPMYYRGQHHDWNITSSMHRFKNKNDEAYMVEMRKAHGFIEWLKQRKEETSLFASVHHSAGDLPFWAIAQHYGYKTDFIDFTTDIDIARAFALLGKQPDENGCITCLWNDDVEIIKHIYKSNKDNMDVYMQRILESTDYNPFFSFELPVIPRIANQKGLFLWDVGSLATQLFSGKIEDWLVEWKNRNLFRFIQTDISATPDIYRRIYPSSSIVEREIDHFVQNNNHNTFYQKNDMEYVFPRINIDLSAYFTKNTWDDSHLFDINPNEYYPSDKQKSVVVPLSHKEINKLMVNLNACRDLAAIWKHSLNQNQYILFVCKEQDMYTMFVEIIIEILSSLSQFNNLPAYILGIVILRTLLLLNSAMISCKINQEDLFSTIKKEIAEYEYDLTDSQRGPEHILDLIRHFCPLNGLAKYAWKIDPVFIRLENDTRNTVAIPLPKDRLLDCKKKYKSEHLRVLHDLYDKSLIPPTVSVYENKELKRITVDKKDISWELMLGIVWDPMVLFDQYDSLDFLFNYIIPWQMVMCPRANRIYNPYDIYRVTRLDVDSFIEEHEIHYHEGGYYIFLEQGKIYVEDIYSI